MGAYQRLELAEQLAVAAQLEVELDAGDHRCEALFLEPRSLGGEHAVDREAGQWLPAPEAEGLLDGSPGGRRLAGRAGSSGPCERVFPAVDIAVARLHG